jgi:uncharacterized tellurite resistance protein B-like protein
MIPNTMIDRLIALFGGAEGGRTQKTAQCGERELWLAAAGLLAHAAALDGEVHEDETRTIRNLLRSHFDLDHDEVEELLEEGHKEAAESTQLFQFTRVINDKLDPDERVNIVEMLWEVVYADGNVHHYESNLIRRVAGLLHVSDRDSGSARKRVTERH